MQNQIYDDSRTNPAEPSYLAGLRAGNELLGQRLNPLKHGWLHTVITITDFITGITMDIIFMDIIMGIITDIIIPTDTIFNAISIMDITLNAIIILCIIIVDITIRLITDLLIEDAIIITTRRTTFWRRPCRKTTALQMLPNHFTSLPTPWTRRVRLSLHYPQSVAAVLTIPQPARYLLLGVDEGLQNKGSSQLRGLQQHVLGLGHRGGQVATHLPHEAENQAGVHYDRYSGHCGGQVASC